MNKLTCFAIALLSGGIVKAQSMRSDLTGLAFAEAYDVHGTPFTEINKNDFDGTPYLNESWTKGQVKMRSGMAIKDIDLQVNLYSNKLMFRKNDTVFLFANPVSEFTLLYPDIGDSKRVLFRCGYPDATPTGQEKFYMVLADGSKLHLVKYIYKVLADEVNYGGPVRKEYQQKEQLFIYDAADGILVPAKKSKSALIKSLPSYADKIQSFKSGDKLSGEDDLVKLVNDINQSTIMTNN